MPTGQYCGDFGLTEPSGDCTGGYYCPGGQNSSTPVDYQCTPGHKCPTGSLEQVPCQAGEYQDEFTQVDYLSSPFSVDQHTGLCHHKIVVPE